MPKQIDRNELQNDGVLVIGSSPTFYWIHLSPL